LRRAAPTTPLPFIIHPFALLPTHNSLDAASTVQLSEFGEPLYPTGLLAISAAINPGSICFHTLVVYFNLDLVTGLEIAVNCFITLSLEQLVPRADRTDPVLAYNNLRWHSLDRRGRNHLSNGLHRKLDLASSTHC
jgi:hypothetical protein